MENAKDLIRFENILKFTLKSEGGYVNDADDPGGATNKGITQRTYNQYRQDYKGIAQQSVKDISDAEVEEIYYELYWEIAGCDRLPFPIAEVVFDTAVNCGVQTSRKMLQRAAGVEDDGVFGKMTIEAIGKKDAYVIADAFLDERRKYYDAIIARNAKLEKYRKGWNNRVSELKKYMVELGVIVC